MVNFLKNAHHGYNGRFFVVLKCIKLQISAQSKAHWYSFYDRQRSIV